MGALRFSPRDRLSDPARDLGPRIITALTGWGSAATTAWWVYTLGPLAGGVLGATAYKMLLSSDTRKAQ